MRLFRLAILNAIVGLAAGVIVAFFNGPAAAQTSMPAVTGTGPQTMSYVDIWKGKPPAEVSALWGDILAKNDADPSWAFLKKNGNGHVPATALYVAFPDVLVSILRSATTCEPVGNHEEKTWTKCAARIFYKGKITRSSACFMEAYFDPMPGETPQNRYSAASLDAAKNTVTFNGIAQGKAQKDCAITVRF